MIRFLVLWLVAMFAATAYAAPSVTEGSGLKGRSFTITIAQNDTTDSKAIPVDGVCSVRARIEGSDVVEVWGVNATAAAATSGTQVGTDITASTTVPIVERPGTFFWKVKGTTATAGGSQVQIDCNPLTSAGGGGGVLGSGTLAEMLAANPDQGDLWFLTEDSDRCAAGTGSEYLLCAWDEDLGWLPSRGPAASIEQRLYSWKIESAFTVTTWSSTSCLEGIWESFEADALASCTTDITRLSWSRPVTITEIALVTTAANGNAAAGCDFRLTIDGGTTGMLNSTFSVPATNAAFAAGDIFKAENLSLAVPAGTPIAIQAQDGTYAQTGTPDCSSGWINGNFEIWGIIE